MLKLVEVLCDVVRVGRTRSYLNPLVVRVRPQRPVKCQGC
jgi:hypothetical protein